jgi:murein DD-endopeptidase MepM/ murein hydrolase activator NlpD
MTQSIAGSAQAGVGALNWEQTGSSSGTLFFMIGTVFGILFMLSGLFSPFTSLNENPQGAEPLLRAVKTVKTPVVADVPQVITYETAFGPALPEGFPARRISVSVKPGDTLMDLLTAQKIPAKQAFLAIEAMAKVYSPRKIRVGQEVRATLTRQDGELQLQDMAIELSSLKSVHVQKSEKGFSASLQERIDSTQLARARGVIHSSFYQAADDAGLTARVIMELMNLFSYDVDFQRDIKSGQQVEVLFEQLLDHNKKVIGQGDVKYATFQLGKEKLEIYRFVHSDGTVGYYHPNGESIRTALLRTPVNGARISSGYGMRHHPVLGYSKMHKGIDFAAPTGTPVYAAGDGKIEKAGRLGGYGNYLRIKHNDTYATAYAHLHRFARGMRPGKRVKQGQVVAYVGTTGRSTGPHLHYEILKYGKQTNPTQVKFKQTKKLKGKELASFKAQQKDFLQQIANLPPISAQVALADAAAQ